MDCPIENRYPSRRFSDAAVAQWIEYWPPKPRVVGSIPASRANTQGPPCVGMLIWAAERANSLALEGFEGIVS